MVWIVIVKMSREKNYNVISWDRINYNDNSITVHDSFVALKQQKSRGYLIFIGWMCALVLVSFGLLNDFHFVSAQMLIEVLTRVKVKVNLESSSYPELAMHELLNW